MSQSSLFGFEQSIIIEDDGIAKYYQDFFTASEANTYLEKSMSINWRQDKITSYGKEYDLPRETAWYSLDGFPYTYSGIEMISEEMPDFIKNINQRVSDKAKCDFNSVLLNKYRDGNDSVSWHSDNEKELGNTIDIASVSFGEERDFLMRKRSDHAVKEKIPLVHGSLLIMKHPLQLFWEHSIPKRKNIDKSRVNMTFRKIIR